MLEKIGNKRVTESKMKEIHYLIQAIFFIISIFLWIISIPLNFRDFASYLVFLFALIVTSLANQGDMKNSEQRALFLGILGSITIAFFLIFILEPMFNQNYTIHFVFVDFVTPNSTYLTMLSAIIFFIAGFLGIRYTTFLASIITSVKKEQFNNQKSIFAHIQLIPLFLLPLFIFQITGTTEFLEPFTTFLYKVSLTLLFLLPYCLFLTLLGGKIQKLKFIWITSIPSLISFSNAIFVAFQFIVENLQEGAFALGTIISWLLCSTLGIIAARYGDYPISTWLNTAIDE